MGPWLVGPAGPHGSPKLAAHTTPARDYTRLESKNIFIGLADAAALAPAGSGETQRLDYIQVTSIIFRTDLNGSVAAKSAAANQNIALKAESGFDNLIIRAATGQIILKAKVKAISRRSLLFQDGETFYTCLRSGAAGFAQKSGLPAPLPLLAALQGSSVWL